MLPSHKKKPRKTRRRYPYTESYGIFYACLLCAGGVPCGFLDLERFLEERRERDFLRIVLSSMRWRNSRS